MSNPDDPVKLQPAVEYWQKTKQHQTWQCGAGYSGWGDGTSNRELHTWACVHRELEYVESCWGENQMCVGALRTEM